MLISLLIFILSLAGLIYASNLFIDSAEKFGLSMGISPFIVGVTLVAFGTSLPELTTSIIAVLDGSAEIVVGNVVGSNITNILLVLGVSALMAGYLQIEHDVMKEDMPLLIGSSLLLWFACLDQHFSRVEALIFLSLLAAFVFYSIRDTGKDAKTESKLDSKLRVKDILIMLVSGVGIFFSAKYCVHGMEDLALALSVSPSIISLSLLALGTSLPEVVVSVTAARKGKHSIALGNVMGSNIFNTYGVMTISSFFGELIIPDHILEFSLPFMVAVSFLMMLVCYSRKVSFGKAGMLLSFYIFYLAELIRMGFVN